MKIRERYEIIYYDREKLKERFWNKVIVGEHEECWPWIGATVSRGYGVIVVGTFTDKNGKQRVYHNYAHRLSLELDNGYPVPDNMQVCHSCDNPPCVNPEHLWIGTAKDNMRDAVAKGHHSKGIILDDDQVRGLFDMYDAGATPDEIRHRLNISHNTLTAYIKGKKQSAFIRSVKLLDGRMRSSKRKLSPQEVRWLREVYKNPSHPEYKTIDELAAVLDIDKMSVSRIARRIGYPDIE